MLCICVLFLLGVAGVECKKLLLSCKNYLVGLFDYV
jgi:hypothetical protein